MPTDARVDSAGNVFGRCLHELVLEQAGLTPGRIAIRARDGSLTYAGLASRSLAIARHLRALGIEAETRVGIFMPRTRNLPAAMVGALVAGGAYVPLDPALPDERVHFLLEDADACAVLTTTALAPRVRRRGIRIVDLEAEPQLFAGLETDGFEAHSEPGCLAYVIYTSGSTGAPKGVMVEHRNVAVMIDWAHREYSQAELSRVIAASSIAFDLSVFEIFAPLTCGGSIDLIEDGLSFARWPWRAQATLLNTVPSVARELLALGALPPQLPVVNLAGEQLAKEIVEGIWRACPGSRVYNLYGPSEDTTYSTGGVVQPGDATPTIGYPLTWRHLYLLDPQGRPVVNGEIGEIFVGGPGVSRGYLGRPDLTEAAYFPDPAGPAGSRMYRTGDFGRALPDGRIDYLGRRDDQIKLRGFRIELGEVDAVLRSNEGVEELATVAVSHPSRGTFLRCVLVLHPGIELTSIQAWAAARLPPYGMPSEWLPVAALPKLANKKLDRKALRLLKPAAREEGGRPPESAEERQLAQLWSELLGVARVRREDDFFSLGGHSLLAVRLAVRVRETFGVDLPQAHLLRAGTLRGQADLIRAAPPQRDEPIPACEPAQGPAPCSSAQLRMWTLEKLVAGSARYNIPLAVRLRGPLDLSALAEALRNVAERHEILRTVYLEREGELQQSVLPVVSELLRETDVSELADAPLEASRLATQFAGRCFNLSEQPPFKALVVNIAPHDRLLVIATHHIALDGSLELLIEALGTAYAEALAGGGGSPEALHPTYIDFAAWQRGMRTSEADLAYWREALRDPPPPLPLPADRPAAPVSSGCGGRFDEAISTDLFQLLARLASARGMSLFQVLLAVTWSVLARICETDDVCVAVPLVDRPHPGLAGTLGSFANTVVLRGTVADDPSFAGILDQARERTTAALEHGTLPFDHVVEAVPSLRWPGGNISINVMLSFVGELPPLGFQDVESEPVHIAPPTSRFDLSFLFRQERGGLVLSIEYDGDRFEPDTAGRYARHWTSLAGAALANPELPLSRLPLLDADQRKDMLERWNRTTREYDSERLIHELFEERARNQPLAIAVTGADCTLSYAELDERASHVAAVIRSHRIDPGARIAILCDRTPHLIVAMLAVLKAGCAYVPFDPASPADRQAAMLDIAEADALITDTVCASRAKALCAQRPAPLTCIAVDADYHPAAHLSPSTGAASPDDLAYVIFTSGTTGLPKAVAVCHRPVINLIDWVNRTFDVGQRDRLLFLTSVAFDLSVYDVFGTLAAGGSIRIAEQAEVQDPARLADILVEEPITFWDSTPIALQQCVPYLAGRRTRALRLVFLSGDWIPVTLPDRVRGIAPSAELIALGGATEAVVWSNYHRIGTMEPGQTSIPYGRPIQNARYYILDARLEPVPIGVPGDLFIGGEVLAQGYLGDAELTAARFIPDPVGGAGQRLYRTGDRARYWADGTIEFLGRLDSQVKIRGFRVEAGEIETVLAEQEGVRAVHVAIRGPREDRSLCAYVVPERPDAALLPRLREQLRRRLPEYMIPAAIVLLDEFPLSVNGKLDRSRLPEPQPAILPGAGGIQPGNALEAGIAEIWRQVLGVEHVDMHENFFDAGGNSVRLVETHRAIEALAGRRLPMVELFRHTTISALAAWLGESAAAAGSEGPKAELKVLDGRQPLARRRS